MFGYFQYILIKAFSLLVNFLPEDIALRLGRFLGGIAFFLDKDHRNVAIENLTIAFGKEKSEEEIRSIAKKAFQNMGLTAVEFFRIPKMDIESFKKRIIIKGIENVKETIENRKNGILLLLSHLGNWEMMGVLPKFLGLPISVVVRPIKKNRWLNRMVFMIKESCGIEIIDKERASKRIIHSLSENRFVGILIKGQKEANAFG
jgi:KDO2-lipid IV(A) lauroyltransferase